MKKTLIASALLSAGLAFAGSASALTVAGTDVGSEDVLLASAQVNSGINNENAWVNSTLDSLGYGTGWVFTQFDAKDEWDNTLWKFVDGSTDLVAFDFGADAADFYFIKIGTGNTGTNIDHYLYKNLSSLQWAVLSLGGLGVSNMNIGKISHSGTSLSQVPLPGAAWLFGSALLGFMAVANRRRV